MEDPEYDRWLSQFTFHEDEAYGPDELSEIPAPPKELSPTHLTRKQIKYRAILAREEAKQ